MARGADPLCVWDDTKLYSMKKVNWKLVVAVVGVGAAVYFFRDKIFKKRSQEQGAEEEAPTGGGGGGTASYEPSVVSTSASSLPISSVVTSSIQQTPITTQVLSSVASAPKQVKRRKMPITTLDMGKAVARNFKQRVEKKKEKREERRAKRR
jgi:hypothetical protein